MGIFKWIFLGPNPLEIISLGYNYFQKLFFEKILPQILQFWRPSKLKILKKISTFQPISKQIADVKKNLESHHWPAIDALTFGYHSFSVPYMVSKLW